MTVITVLNKIIVEAFNNFPYSSILALIYIVLHSGVDPLAESFCIHVWKHGIKDFPGFELSDKEAKQTILNVWAQTNICAAYKERIDRSNSDGLEIDWAMKCARKCNCAEFIALFSEHGAAGAGASASACACGCLGRNACGGDCDCDQCVGCIDESI